MFNKKNISTRQNTPEITKKGLTVDDIIEAYLQLLGRPPETPEVIEDQRRMYGDTISLWRAITQSPEYIGRKVFPYQEHKALMNLIVSSFNTPQKVEHDVDQQTMDTLVDRIRQQWFLLGENEPHWSVLTNDEFRSEKLTDDRLKKFRESGRGSAEIIGLFEKRANVNTPKGTCLELGCGVGRVTRFLAERFDSVVGVDISPGNIKLCQEYMRETGTTNVDTILLSSIDEFADLPNFDFLFTVIVLQHNSPPIQKSILDTLLGKIRPGGGALFQIPTDIPGYEFDAASYLASPSPDMEIHALPKPVILDLLRRHDMELLDVIPDGWIGMYGSNTFYARKAGSADRKP